ncbi:MAG: DMT family transporter [Anaerolineae bacterium]
MTRSQRDGLLLIITSATGYSFFSIFTKIVYDNGMGNPLDILTWRFVLAAPLAWLYILVSRSKSSADEPTPIPRVKLLAVGVLFGVVATLAFYALERLPVSLYTVLIYTYPAMVALGSLLFGERLSGRGWFALGLTLIGVALTVPNIFKGFEGVDPLGVILVLGNAASYAAYILLSGRLLRGARNLTSASVWSITGSLLFVVLVTGIRFAGESGPLPPPNIGVWVGLAGLILISTILPIITFYAGLNRLGAARAAIVSMIEPVLTLIWAVLLRGETLSSIQIIGGLLILFSVVLLNMRQRSESDITATLSASLASD